jgi:hypothetical protein
MSNDPPLVLSLSIQPQWWLFWGTEKDYALYILFLILWDRLPVEFPSSTLYNPIAIGVFIADPPFRLATFATIETP